MQKVTIFFIAVLSAFILFSSFAKEGKEKVKWLTATELQAAYKSTPKPILVDVYTDWCGWCKVMDRETYSNPKVAAYINEHYYAIKFDAERKDSVQWWNKKYGYNPDNRANDLAVYFLGGQMSFPTTVFIASPDAQPAPLAGFLKPKEIEPPLKYFGDGHYKSKNFPEFMKGFNASW